ncbi:MAG: HAD-IIIA family hydrolase [Verrucomicrobia bacterium]|nr:HAD-IIIA family hydrolase [Verrucomicrobiota bacterium]
MCIQQAVILCGGRGTRLGALAKAVPKPMLPVGGRPVLEQIIEVLAAAGVRRFLLAAGYQGEVIAEYFSGRRAGGLLIETHIETAALGTAGAVRALAGRLDEQFVLAYGDVFLDFDARALLAAHERERPLATLLARASDHPWDSDLLVADEEGRVSEFVHGREPGRRYANLANAAAQVLAREVLDFVPEGRAVDFGAEVYPKVVAAGKAVRVHELEPEGFVKDMGTPERLAAVEAYLEERAAAAAARAAPGPVRTVLLDRDGVLTPDLGPGARAADLSLLPGVGEALARLRRRGLRCVVVTNQPGVARGLITEVEVEAAHERLRALAVAAGGEIAAIFHCPHHPETQHGEGVAELRRGCRCRKPAPGLIFRAWREAGVELAGAVMVGDREVDVRAGRAAGVRTVRIGAEGECEVRAEARFDSLLAFAEALENGAAPGL